MYKYGVLLMLCCSSVFASPRLSPTQAQKLMPNLDECSVCTFVVGWVEKLVDLGEPEIESALKGLCSDLGPVASVCELVASELPAVLKYIEASMPPKAICSELGLCSAAKKSAIPLQRSSVLKPPKNPQVFGITECSVCSWAIKKVEDLVELGEKALELKLRTECLAFGPVSFVCDKVINELPAVLHYIEQEFPPEWICKELSLCSEEEVKTSVQVTVLKRPAPVHAQALPNLDECSVCTFVVGFVEKLVDLGEPEIESELKGLCSKLGPVASVCELVASELPAVVHYLEQSWPAKKICEEISLCATPQNVQVKAIKTVPQQVAKMPNDGCSVCTMIVNYMETLVNQGEPEIEQKLKEYCSSMGPLRTPCESLTNMLPVILKYLEQSVPPKQICTELGLCTSQNRPFAINELINPKVKNDVPNLGGCSVCTFIVQYIETLVNQGEPAIEDKLKELCGSLGPLSSVCDSMVAYLPQIIDYLEKELTPKEICTEIGLCSGA